jgi:hypothetical protein
VLRAASRRDNVATDVEARIEEFAKSLDGALGGNMSSLLLYGSRARGQASARSDINLLLVLRDASARALRDGAEALGRWARNGETPPLVFSEEEWRASADVFPLEIEDMREAHRVIRGSNPLTSLRTDRAQLRQQLEREIRGKLLHLRTEYAAVGGDAKALARLLENSVSTFLVFGRAMLKLKQAEAPQEAEALARETGKAAGFDPAPFLWALASRNGRAPRSLGALDPLAAQYVDAVEQLARVVNSL